MNDDELGTLLIGCAIQVHRALGPGLLENVYETCLLHEFLNFNVVRMREGGARSKTKCNICGRECCMRRIYRQLSIEERTMIQTQLEMGMKPAANAAGLNRSASTLARELRRNGWTRPKMCRGIKR
jgi:hypothetical protein